MKDRRYTRLMQLFINTFKGFPTIRPFPGVQFKVTEPEEFPSSMAVYLIEAKVFAHSNPFIHRLFCQCSEIHQV